MEKIQNFSIKNDIKEIDTATLELEKFCSSAGIPNAVMMNMSIVMDEIINNIVSYAFNDKGEHIIQVSMRYYEGILTISFSDDGKPFNPLEKEDPELCEDLKDREIGGLGIFLVKNLMDDICYKREGERNILFVSKSV